MKKIFEDKKRTYTLIGVLLMVVVFFTVFFFSDNEELKNRVVEDTAQMAQDLVTYEMTEKDIKELPSKEIVEQTEQQEKEQEQEVEDEGFELQGEIAYEGDRARSWNVELGDYKGLTYYSQIDGRWSGKMYSSIGDRSQTIGKSGCGPTSASMIVTACKGAITPDTMADLFVKYGYRSSNNGTYWSAFRAIADEFNIGYTETSDIQQALQLLASKHYIVASVGNGLFTTGGHFILLVGVEGNTIKIYDPYLYSGKFETSTRRGKVTISGNTVYCSVANFMNYANAKGFFCYAHDGNIQVNNQPVSTSTYTRYVKANGGLNVRTSIWGSIKGGLANGTAVRVESTQGNWSYITNPQVGWTCSDYLTSTVQTVQKMNGIKTTGYRTGKYKVNASVLNVRTGPGTNYKAKTYKELTTNARSQNKALGNYYTNGYKRGVVCTVTRVSGNWGYTPSGWICLNYCKAL